MPSSKLSVTIPEAPAADHPTSRAVTALDRARRSSESFLKAFDEAISQRGRGAPNDSEQDLLRAMLVFASAGLDASVSHLGRDCATVMFEHSTKLQEEVESFAQKELDISPQGTKFLLNVLRKNQQNLDEYLAQAFMRHQTEDSLQSPDQLFRICSFFEIADADLKKDIVALRDVFRARNLIIHEMDVNFNAPRRRRTSRKREDMVGYTERILNVAAKIIRLTQKKLSD